MPRTWQNLAEKNRLRVVGLMSGTSADGVDVAIVDITDKTPGRKRHRRLDVRVVAFDTRPYPARFRAEIFRLFRPETSHVDDICHMNFALAAVFAEQLIAVARKNRIPLESIDLIGSHGQTIYHMPHGKKSGKQLIRSTLQIGEPSVIAERTGIATVADFRPRDIAAGGQGAPLVPYTDWLLLADPKKTRAVQNIGGIANVTYLPAGKDISDILAFDTGPGNMIIDRLTWLITKGQVGYDRGGQLAAAGNVSDRLLTELLRHKYLRRRPPKTTGREDFGIQFADDLYARATRRGMEPLDVLATATAFTALTIADAYRRFLPTAVDEVILCGGGAWNETLLWMLQAGLHPAKVSVMDEYGISVDAKEAVSFAILAYETIHNRPNNAPAATGARHPAVLGKIVPGR